MSNEISRLTWRHKTLFSIIILLSITLIGRLFFIQVISHQNYIEQANNLHSSTQKLNASRGTIYDRNHYPLATSINTWDVFIDSSKFNTNSNLNEIELLCSILEIKNCASLTNEAIQSNNQLLVKRKITFTNISKINQLNFKTIYSIDSSKRIYPEKNLAGQLIGYVGLDQQGLWGIEKDFDEILSGKAGIIYSEKDPFGRPIVLGQETIKEPTAGSDIILTIDKYIQSFAQSHLLQAINENKAESGSILVMNPLNGEILAMANYPEINLTDDILMNDNLSKDARNKIISDIYEPGSVMKLITSAIAFDLNLITPETTYVDKGYVDVGPQRIQNWDFNTYGETSIKNHLIHSLNTGAVWIAQKIGAEKYYNYLKKFGFGTTTSLGLSGESRGILRTNESSDWYPIDLATNSYGQGIGATPLQVLSAVNVLINNGKLMQPNVIKEILNGIAAKQYEPKQELRVIGENSSKLIKEMMYAIVNENIYHQAKVDGFKAAGKTGTTINMINQEYDWDYTIATFAGFVPYNKPEISILVKIDYPQGNSNLGGEVAAPVFAKLAADILEYLEIAPINEMVKSK